MRTAGPAFRASTMEPNDTEDGKFILLEGVSKSYDEHGNRREVLRNLDFSIGKGQFVALLGRSGAGKSTLLNLLGGLDVPTAGRVSVGGQRIDGLGEDERTLFRRRNLGFVFQSFNLIPTLNVMDNLLLPLQLAGKQRGSAAAGAQDQAVGENDHTRNDHTQSVQSAPDRARWLLEEVGLADRGASWPDRLSGGEQQRVAIARALAAAPMLLLADEPTGNLDYQTGRTVMDLLHRLVRETHTTMLVVTHDRDFLQASDRIVRLHEGRVQEISIDEATAR